MATIALINPSPRKRHRRTKKHRSAAQRAATARMLAANRSRRRGSNPSRKRHARRAARRSPARYYGMNPVKRRSSRRRARSSGAGVSTRGIMGAVKPAVVGAAGAVVVQAVGNMLSGVLPAGIYEGYTKHAINAGLALALGRFGRRFAGQSAVTMQHGALAIIAYQVLRDLINGTSMGTSFGLSGMGYTGSGRVFPGLRAPMLARPGMAEYFPSSDFNGVNASGGLSEYFPTF